MYLFNKYILNAGPEIGTKDIKDIYRQKYLPQELKAYKQTAIKPYKHKKQC